MIVTALKLTDFRSYAAVELELGAGATVFLGANGQGKTNLVEAVEYLSTLSSHRVASDQPLVRSGATRAVLQARVRAGPDDPRGLTLDLEIRLGAANQARLNKAPVRPRDLLGAIRTVLFAPEDLAIVKGDPSDRRAFIDALATSRWPRLAGVRADLERVLRQRASLLKGLSNRSTTRSNAADTLGLWDEQLVALGAELVAARLDTVARLAPLYAERYATLAAVPSQVHLGYRSAVEPAWATGSGVVERAEIEVLLAAAIERRRDDEIARGLCLVGPQRDDLALELDGLPLKGYASHGESWSASLGLRLGSFDLLRQDGVEPVLILDDVFAELDASRRRRLAQAIDEAQQVLLTAAVEQDLPAGLVAIRHRVVDGRVEPERTGSESVADPRFEPVSNQSRPSEPADPAVPGSGEAGGLVDDTSVPDSGGAVGLVGDAAVPGSGGAVGPVFDALVPDSGNAGGLVDDVSVPGSGGCWPSGRRPIGPDVGTACRNDGDRAGGPDRRRP
ncbi:MAG: DNA replication/repair protein RecF [Propionibacteriaceae bacterium]|nr:DNA replication/repair protein RecF [Propionibacteriaceae bacterium]